MVKAKIISDMKLKKNTKLKKDQTIVVKKKDTSSLKNKKDKIRTVIKEEPEIIKENIIKSKSKKYVMPSQSVTGELVDKCLNALEEMAKHYKQKNKMFEDETPVFAEINCLKIQNGKGKITFSLPHSTISSTGEVCLITPDLKKGKKVDHEPTIDHWEEILKQAHVTNVKTVLPLRQLRVEYDQYELKRRLLTQHDFIMVDTRVLSHVTHILGKMFLKKHNMIIPVKLHKNKDLKKSILKGLSTAILRLSEGPTSTILIGHLGMATNEIKSNILSLLEQLRNKFPGGEANIRSIAIKLPLSLSLPLYTTLRPTSTVKAPKLHKEKSKNSMDVEGELSTIPGAQVRVTADGTVHLKKNAIKDKDGSENQSEDEKEIDEVEELGDDSE